MSTWYVASNITPGDNSGLDMVPNPGTYADLNTGDAALVMIDDVLTTYVYDATSALTESLPQVITPNGNAGNGRWILGAMSPRGQNGFDVQIGPQPNTLATLGVAGTTFTMTHVADYDFFINGVTYTKTGNETVEITDVIGMHWIYFDSEGTIQIQAPGGSTDDIILENCLIAAVYWDGDAAILLFDERHGNSMAPATHYHLHETIGALYENGLGLSGFDIDGSGDDLTAAQFDINSGNFHDEDNEIAIATALNATIDTFYMIGTTWFKEAAGAGFPVAAGTVGTTLDWNDYNGGTWQRLAVTSGKYVLTHYFATNDLLSATGIIGIMGQNEYSNIVAARAGAESELNTLITAGLPVPEIMPIASVLWQTNTTYANGVKARAISPDTGETYVDWRTTPITGAGVAVSDHENLAGLLGGAAVDHYHITGAQHTSLTTGVDEGDLHLHDSIDEGNSKVEVVDAGAGTITITADGNTEVDVTDAGMRLGGANSRVNAILDEDDMTSDSATSIATQQSIKAYVRDNAGDAAVPRIDFYQDWLQETKYLNSTVVTMTVENTMVSAHDMTYNIENKRYDFTVGEYITSADLYDSDLSLTDITEAIADLEVTDSAAGTFQISNDGGSNWITITDTTQVTEFVTSDIDLRLKYTAGGTGYITHMGVLYNPDTIYAPATEVVVPGDNIIINGDFDIWQRGTSFPAAATSAFTADRFKLKKSSDAVVTLTRDTDVPTQAESDHLSNYSHKLDVTTADAAIAAGQFQSMAYLIEGYDFAPVQGKYGTFSFWVKSTKTGIFCLSMWNSGADNYYIAEYTVNASDTWEKKTITVNFNGADTGTWDYTNGTGLEIRWIIACGSTYHGTADTWQASQKIATSNQVNGLDNTANNFLLAQIKFEEGQVATPWKARPFANELALCQRYYQFGTSVDSIATVYNASYIQSAPISWLTEMRATPTMVLTPTWLPASGGGWGTIGALYTNHRDTQYYSFGYNTVGGTLGYSGKVYYDFTADAEL